MKTLLYPCLVLCSFLLCHGCSTGVEESPQPGIFRVTLVANEADSILVILGDTARCSRIDRYNVVSSKGRLYNGENYVDLYVAPTIDRDPSLSFNLLQRQWPDGKLIGATDPFEIPRYKTLPVTYTIFEWHTPPGTYDKFEFGLTGIEVFVAIPRQFNNPLQFPPGVTSVMDFPREITINAGRVTQFDLVIDPYKSIRRFQDSYIFDRKISVSQVKNY